MKIRNVKIIANLAKVETKYKAFDQATLDDMVKVLESSHWDENVDESIKNYKTRLEGEKNSALKKLSNKEIALLIFDKVQVIDGVTWHIVSDVDLATYNGPSNVIGYGLPSDDITRQNTDFLASYMKDKVSGKRDAGHNIIHEKMHDRGSDHASNSTPTRANSIAYVLGYAYQSAYDEVFKEKLEDPGTVVTEPTPTVPDPIKTPPVVMTSPIEPVKTVRVCGWTRVWGFIPWYKCWDEVQ